MTIFLLIFKLDEQIEDLFKSKRTTKNKTELAAAAAAATATGTAGTATSGVPSQAAIAALANSLVASAQQQSVADKLKMAKGIADKVSANKTTKDNVDQLTRSILGGGPITSNLTVYQLNYFSFD